jgi:hypothetical protein
LFNNLVAFLNLEHGCRFNVGAEGVCESVVVRGDKSMFACDKVSDNASTESNQSW